MRMGSAIAVLVALLLFGCSDDGLYDDTPSIRYDVLFEPGEHPSLLITAHMSGDGGGTFGVFLPTTEVNGASGAFEIVDVEVLTDNSSIEEWAPNWYILYYPPDGHATVQYRIVRNEGAEPHLSDGVYISNDYIHLQGAAAWLVPSWNQLTENPDLPVEVEYRWRGFPSGWNVAHSLGSGRRGFSARAAIISLYESEMLAGPISIRARTDGDATHRLATLGESNTTTDELLRVLDRVAAGYDDLWGERYSGGYLAAILFSDTHPPYEANEAVGFASGNGFIAYLDGDNEDVVYKTVVAHEYGHRWLDLRLGDPEPPYGATRWFTEGFTDFFANLVLLRTDEIDLYEFLNLLSYSAAELSSHPMATVGIADYSERWEQEPTLHSIAYSRGQLLALRWYLQIYDQSDGEDRLEAALRRLMDQQQLLLTPQARPTWNNETILSALEGMGYDFVRGEFQRFIVDGKIDQIEAERLGSCLMTVSLPASATEPELRLLRIRPELTELEVAQCFAPYRSLAR